MVKQTGIYTITNQETGEFYIGSAADLQKRRRQHLSLLKGNKHYNTVFQDAYNKNPNFKFRGIETPDRECAYNLEQNALNDNFGDSLNLNMSLSARPCGPTHHSSEALEKVIKRITGNKYCVGRVMSPETRAKISAGHTGLSWGDRVQTETQKEATEKSFLLAQEARKRPIEVDGVAFKSISEAAREMNLNKVAVRKRVLSASDRFKTWQFKENENGS